MQKLILVYNPQASHYAAVEREVIAPARQLKGYMVGRFAVQAVDFASNVQKLMPLISDGDLVIAAGGDGTAAIAVNAILRSGKDVTLAVLGYGNFNDLAGTLGVANLEEALAGFRRRKSTVADGVAEALAVRKDADISDEPAVRPYYPLEIKVDGELWRYAAGYFTLGMFARSTAVFDQPRVRQALQSGQKSLRFSLWQLAKWYLRRGKKTRLPAGSLNGMDWSAKTTDYIALNSRTMAHLLKGGDWYQRSDEFLSTTAELGNLCRLGKFMLAGMREQVPGTVRAKDRLVFAESSTVELHAEGEYETRENVSEIIVSKSVQPLKVAGKW